MLGASFRLWIHKRYPTPRSGGKLWGVFSEFFGEDAARYRECTMLSTRARNAFHTWQQMIRFSGMKYRHTQYTGGNRTKLPSSRWRRRGRSLREVFACSCFFATTDLSQIYNRETRRHGTPCTKTTDSYLFSFLYNDPRKIRRETTVGKCVPNNGRR